jgi:hypothetical protein
MAGRIAYLGNIVTQGLILDLDAAKKESYPGSGTTWSDISGNALTGNFTQINFTSSINYTSNNYGGLIFPGTDSDGNGGVSVRFADNPVFKQTQQYSIDLWLQCDIPSNDEWIVVNGVGSLNGSQFNYAIRKLSSIYTIYISDGTNSTSLTTSISASSTVHNLQITVDYQTNIKAYLNGSNTYSTSSMYSNYNGNNQKMEIGGLIAGGSTTRFFTGTLYKASLYSRALSQAEVQQNFNAYRTRYGI